ncbi:MAG: hypothetical protein ACI9A0_002753 [Pseudoalteromonas tetraodonis]
MRLWPWVKSINKQLKQTLNARRFWFALILELPRKNQMGSNLDFKHQTHVATL